LKKESNFTDNLYLFHPLLLPQEVERQNCIMILRSIFAVLIFSLFIVACADNKDSSSKSENSESQEQMETPETQDNSSSETKENTMRLKSAQNSGAVTGSNATPVTPAGINPPHGQPGHDCKIPVGQPLDGSTLNMNNSSQPQAPTFQAGPRVQSSPQPSSGSSTGTTAGLNPPHGQPGHDCSIPVGQPLK
jgi:hypothetical protein